MDDYQGQHYFIAFLKPDFFSFLKLSHVKSIVKSCQDRVMFPGPRTAAAIVKLSKPQALKPSSLKPSNHQTLKLCKQ